MNPNTFAAGRLWALAGLFALPALTAHAADTTPAQQLSHWTAQAGAPAKSERGQALFNQRHGGEWSCASCHGTPPTAQGKHASTSKAIAPLAPAFNDRSLTDTAKTDKWFKRNCKDVLSRECSAQEKADVLAYLVSLKP
ncbi:cytochrome C [Limnohabitans sp. T6-5]|uniref:DUF1924 domain-containing protein n=1 Tax=Limnohabitans sp. T6-5 TaxID=1100724 RepID=UPI000D35D875|nr:cytochrome C [Limnohabitans sp. T6-5]